METKVAKAQQEVWEWKEAAYESLKHIPEKDRISHILNRVKDTVTRIKRNQAPSSGEAAT